MIKNKIFLILICFLLLLTGCVKNNTSITTNSSEYRNVILDFDTSNFSHNGYKIVFDLYDGDTKVDSISKSFIVR